ncbi:hypothetical protein ACIA5D_19150 [Actinoplanes sp. NPDC051513]|uniref:hypothetical protein n=1 Tax=Actinoplanes sp. NPDC051513 TaxID=3363908 RepID=UPI0037B19D0F
MRDPAPEPEWRLPDQPDPDPGGRPVHAVLISLLALAVLCCGGVGLVRAFTGGDDAPDTGAVAGGWREPAPFARATTAAVPLVPRVAVRTSASKAPPKRTKRPSSKPATKKPTTRPTTKPTTRPTPSPTVTAEGPIVRPGAFCSPVGAIGYTAKGKMMRCTRRTGEARARWRAV